MRSTQTQAFALFSEIHSETPSEPLHSERPHRSSGSPRRILRGSLSQRRQNLAPSDQIWQRFIRRYDRRLRYMLASFLRRYRVAFQPQDLEDHVQELYLRLLKYPQLFKHRSHLWKYLEVLGRSLALDLWRRSKRLKRNVCILALDGGLDILHSDEPDPEERVLRREARQMFFKVYVRRLVRGRHTRDKQCAVFLALTGWSSHEISNALGRRLSPNQVDVLVHRFRRQLAAEGVQLPRRNRRLPRRRAKIGQRWRRSVS